MNIGCHLSVSKGFENMGRTALSIGANTFQFFTRNPRGSSAKEIDENDVKALSILMEKHNFEHILAHASYTLNLCSNDEHIRKFARDTLSDDLKRLETLPCNLYALHPGSHVRQGERKAIKYIIDALNKVLKEKYSTIILLETMSGKGSEIGKTFEELKEIIDGVTLKKNIGVCFDTCHLFTSGYDIVNDLDGVLNKFNKIIGLDKLKAVHLNDSLMPYKSYKDRHAPIGKGQIGLDAIKKIINHKKLSHLPFLLETPNDIKGYEKEIKLLKNTKTT